MKHYLIITIDTEEDLWGGYAERKPPVENLKMIPLLQEIFQKYNAVPTYLINYPVAIDNYSIELLSKLYAEEKCDIGTHCHPWNSPPFTDDGDTEYNSFLCNLSEELVFEKMVMLHSTIVKNFGFTPVVFRAGRWGIGENVINVIKKLGYKIDTSMTPFQSWEKYFGPKLLIDDNEAFCLEVFGKVCQRAEKCIGCKNEKQCIMELPPTNGFFQKNFKFCHRIRTILLSKYLKYLRLIGILDRFGLLNFRPLSPETSSIEDMVKISKAVMINGHRFLNMTFHSTSLLPGSSPFVKNDNELQLFLAKLDQYIKVMFEENVEFIGMSKALEVLD